MFSQLARLWIPAVLVSPAPVSCLRYPWAVQVGIHLVCLPRLGDHSPVLTAVHSWFRYFTLSVEAAAMGKDKWRCAIYRSWKQEEVLTLQHPQASFQVSLMRFWSGCCARASWVEHWAWPARGRYRMLGRSRRFSHPGWLHPNISDPHMIAWSGSACSSTIVSLCWPHDFHSTRALLGFSQGFQRHLWRFLGLFLGITSSALELCPTNPSHQSLPDLQRLGSHLSKVSRLCFQNHSWHHGLQAPPAESQGNLNHEGGLTSFTSLPQGWVLLLPVAQYLFMHSVSFSSCLWHLRHRTSDGHDIPWSVISTMILSTHWGALQL